MVHFWCVIFYCVLVLSILGFSLLFFDCVIWKCVINLQMLGKGVFLFCLPNSIVVTKHGLYFTDSFQFAETCFMYDLVWGLFFHKCIGSSYNWIYLRNRKRHTGSENEHMIDQWGEMVSKFWLRTATFQMDSKQGPTVHHTELSSILYGSLDGRGVWGGMDTWMCMAESLCCSTETITTSLIDYIPVQNKKLINKCVHLQCSMCVSWVKDVNCLLKLFISLQIAFICLLIYQLLRRVLIC